MVTCRCGYHTHPTGDSRQSTAFGMLRAGGTRGDQPKTMPDRRKSENRDPGEFKSMQVSGGMA